MEPASGKALDTAPIAQTNLREHAVTRENKREPSNVALDAIPTIAERVVDVTPAEETPSRRLASMSVERWVEPAPPASAPPVHATHPARTLPRPSWIFVVAAVAFVAVIVWWVTAQRGPSVDPQRVIESQLVAAEAAAKEGHYAEPYEGSALHYYSTVLTIDATNARALAGMQALADRLIVEARGHLSAGRYADAVIALNGARRINPAHRGLPALEGDLRRELQTLAVRAPAVPAATPPAPTASVAASNAKPAPAKKSESTTPALALASVPSAASSVSGSGPKVADVTQLSLAPKSTTTSVPDAKAASTAQVNEKGTAMLAAAGVATTAAVAGTATEIPPAGANALPSGPGTSSADSGSAVPEPGPTAQGSAGAAADVTVEASKKVAILPPIVKYVPPEYPDDARVRGLEGWADLSFLVAPNGDVIDPRVEDSSRRQLFGRPALVAIRKWRYEPPEPGHPSLTQRTRVRIEFQLER